MTGPEGLELGLGKVRARAEGDAPGGTPAWAARAPSDWYLSSHPGEKVAGNVNLELVAAAGWVRGVFPGHCAGKRRMWKW